MVDYDGALASPFIKGHVLVVGVETTDDAESFNVNLKTNDGYPKHYALHFSVRFNSNTIAINSRENNSWAKEEVGPNPLKRGKFQIYILLNDDDQFMIALDGQHYRKFKNRFPKCLINRVSVNGNIKDLSQMDHRQVYPSPYPCVHGSTKYKIFSCDMPRAFVVGDVLIITATPIDEGTSPQFSINIDETSDPNLTALHFNPRFYQNMVVRNTMRTDTKYYDISDEEQKGGMPFRNGQKFKLAIAFCDDRYRFAVDGQYFPDFDYWYRPNSAVLSILSGFWIHSYTGSVQVAEVGHEHIKNSPNCGGFEKYSIWTK